MISSNKRRHYECELRGVEPGTKGSSLAESRGNPTRLRADHCFVHGKGGDLRAFNTKPERKEGLRGGGGLHQLSSAFEIKDGGQWSTCLTMWLLFYTLEGQTSRLIECKIWNPTQT